jgi:hypothetical protein
MKKFTLDIPRSSKIIAPFGDAYEKIGTIQRRLAWPLHKDDTLFQSGRPTGLNIYFSPFFVYPPNSTSVSLLRVLQSQPPKSDITQSRFLVL